VHLAALQDHLPKAAVVEEDPDWELLQTWTREKDHQQPKPEAWLHKW